MPTNASFQIINFALFCTRNMAANCVRFGLLRAVEKPQPLFFNAPTDLIKKKKYIYIATTKDFSPLFPGLAVCHAVNFASLFRSI